MINPGEDISLFSYRDVISMLKVNHFVDVKLVGFKKNGNGNVLIQEQQLFELLDLLGQYFILHSFLFVNNQIDRVKVQRLLVRIVRVRFPSMTILFIV